MSDKEDPSPHVDLLETSRTAVLDTAVQQLRLIHELKQNHRAWTAKSGTSVLPRLAASDAGSDLLFDLARLSAETYKNLLNVTSKHFDGIMDQLRSVTGTPTPESPTPHILLEVSGQPGETKTTTPFCIENPFRVPVEVSFSDPAFSVATDGEDADRKSFHTRVLYRREGTSRGKPLRPGQGVAVAPGGQVKLHATVTLSKDFQRGQCYRGESLVLSQGRVSGLIRFQVTVE